MKEEPTEFYKYLSEQNELTELNLSHTELDVDKVSMKLILLNLPKIASRIFYKK